MQWNILDCIEYYNILTIYSYGLIFIDKYMIHRIFFLFSFYFYSGFLIDRGIDFQIIVTYIVTSKQMSIFLLIDDELLLIISISIYYYFFYIHIFVIKVYM